MSYAFANPALSGVRQTRFSRAVSKRQQQYRTPYVHPRACVASKSDDKPNDVPPPPPPPPGDDELTRKVSGTFVGRVLIEVGAFIAGVTLLVVVALWKACTVVANYVWRAILWLARVRRLGRWACARAYSVGVGLWRSPRRYGAPLLRRISDAFASLATRFREADVQVADARRVDEHAVEVQHMREELVRMREIIERQADKNDSKSPTPPQPPRLILLRHAKSEFDRTGKIADHERCLSPAGVNEATLIGAELSRRGWHYDSVLCSNARRTTETLDRIGNLDVDDVIVTESLYFAVSGEEMATVVDGELPDGKCRLIVAHSPGINQLVERLTGESTIMGTACAALLEFKSELQPSSSLQHANGQWTLVDMVCPAQLQD